MRNRLAKNIPWYKRVKCFFMPWRRPVPDAVIRQRRIEKLRAQGMSIGENCRILTDQFSTEPYLIEIGNDVAIAGGVVFVTHDGAVRMLHKKHPKIQCFGMIRVGDNTQIGQNVVIMHDTTIGRDCIIGAGTVVRGNIPDNSIVVGNPGVIVGRSSLLLERLLRNPNTLETFQLGYEERRAVLEKHFGLTGNEAKEIEAVTREGVS